MKRLFILILIPFFTTAYAQHSANRFDNESESAFQKPASNDIVTSPDTPNAGPSIGGPGGPGEPVPIDDYSGLLLITALGIIIYTTHKKRKLLTQK